jgi:hypothetical protein
MIITDQFMLFTREDLCHRLWGLFLTIFIILVYQKYRFGQSSVGYFLLLIHL